MAIIGDFVSGQSNVSYTRMRALLAESGGGLQEGVVGANDFKGGQRGAGANMSVDAAPGAAWIAIDTGTRNGISHAFSDAVANLSVAAAHATLPRIDQVTLRYNDTAVPTGSGNVPTIQVITGTATSGATIDNRLGAAALPNDSVRLFDIFVGPAVASIVTANIRDRRPWARGAGHALTRTAGSFTGFAGFTAIDPGTGGTAIRIECSGVPVFVTFGITYAAPAAARNVQAQVTVDGTAVLQRDVNVPVSGVNSINLADWYTPTPGSRLFAFRLNSGTADGTFVSDATRPLTLGVVEQVRVSANNGAA